MHLIPYRKTIQIVLVALVLFPACVAEADHSININTASAEALQELTGIGEVKSQSIVDYRQQNGDFNAIEDIQNVSGIGPATFDTIKDHISVGSSSGGSVDDGEEDTDTDGLDEENDDRGTSDEGDEASGGGGSSDEYQSKLASPLELSLTISPTVVVTGAPVTFRADARIEGGEANTTTFEWNLGDGTRAEGKEVTHIYAGSGTYVVVVNAATRSKEDRVKKTLRVYRGSIAIDSIAENTGAVTLHNSGSKEVPLAGWKLVLGAQSHTIPEDTFIPAAGSITLPPAVTGFRFTTSLASLMYPNGETAHRYGEGEKTDTASSASSPVLSRTVAGSGGGSSAESLVAGTNSSPPDDGSDRGDGTIGESDEGGRTVAHTGTSAAAVALARPSTGFLDLWPWLIGLLGVLALGILGFIAVPARPPEESLVDGVAASGDEADEYEIVESVQAHNERG